MKPFRRTKGDAQCSAMQVMARVVTTATKRAVLKDPRVSEVLWLFLTQPYLPTTWYPTWDALPRFGLALADELK